MTGNSLGTVLPTILKEIEGEPGFWRGVRSGVPVYVLCDESHNRMRVMAPVGELRELDPEFLALLLRSNFDRALDAKYSLRGKELWSVFVHPLSTLALDDLGIFVDQVVTLVKNTGSTYASTDLVFGLEDESDLVDLGENFSTGDDGSEDDEDEEKDD